MMPAPTTAMPPAIRKRLRQFGSVATQISDEGGW